jgi:hypothetical protein
VTPSKSPRKVLRVATSPPVRPCLRTDTASAPRSSASPSSWPAWCSRSSSASTIAGFAEHLTDRPDLGRLIGLKAVPHYTTFQKAADRLLASAPARAMFDAVLPRALRDKVRKRRVPRAAVDGTGLESRHVSRYYVKRRSKTGSGTQEPTYSKYPKVVLVTDCRTHLVLAAVAGRGPGSDLGRTKAALGAAIGRARIGTLLGDADYDADWIHEHVRGHGIRTVIPAERGRPSAEPRRGGGDGGCGSTWTRSSTDRGGKRRRSTR